MCASCGCSAGADWRRVGAERGRHDAEHGAGEHMHAGDAHDHHHHHDHDHGHEHPHDHAHGDVHHHHHALRMDPSLLPLEIDLLEKNGRIAVRNRARLTTSGVVALNLIGAPGAGKTALLESTIRTLAAVPVTVIEGDQETDNDAARIRATGCRVLQINTGAGCHLDAEAMARAVEALAPAPASLLLVENVGNLVCPALFDLGETAKVVVMSVTEGEDKPLKYPHVFRAATAVVLTKIDLLPHLDFDLDRLLANVLRVHPGIRIFPVSARSGTGVAAWCTWLRASLQHDPARREAR